MASPHTARFSGPSGIAADASGALYVADEVNFAVRKVLPDGAVSTLAGMGAAGSFDAAQGVDATFGNPRGIAVDAGGYVFVADASNNAVRMIAPDGFVTTHASGFNAPQGIVVTAAALYVVDTGNHVVKSYGAGTPAPLTASPTAPTAPALSATLGSAGAAAALVEGTGAVARFGQPRGMGMDATTGNVAVADGNYYAVRHITPRGRVNTFAGTNILGHVDATTLAARFNTVSSVAVTAAGVHFVTDYSHTIRMITAGGVVTTFTGTASTSGFVDGTGTAATHYHPAEIVVFGTDLHVAEISNHIIRRISIGGAVVSTIAGVGGVSGFIDGPIGCFASPRGYAVDASGVGFVGDGNNYAIRKISVTGTVTTLAGTGATGFTNGVGVDATLSMVQSIGLDAAGYAYVADPSNSAVRVVSPMGLVTTLLTGQSSATGLMLTPAGTLYVAVTGDRVVRVFGAVTSPVTASPASPTLPALSWTAGGTAGAADGTRAVGQLNVPRGISYDDTTNEAVAACSSGNQVKRISAIGRINTFVGDGVAGTVNGVTMAARVFAPYTVAVDAAGATYVGGLGGYVVQAITTGGSVTVLAGSGVIGYAEGTGTGAQFKWPIALDIVGTTTLYVADHADRRVRSVTTAAGVTNLVGGDGVAGFVDGPNANARFRNPRGVAVFGATIFVGDETNFAVRKIAAGGTTTLAGTGATGSVDGVGVLATLRSVFQITVDSSGFVFAPDGITGTLRLIDSATGLVSTVGSGMSGAASVAFNAAGSQVFVSRSSTHSVAAFGVTPPAVTAASDSPLFPLSQATTAGLCGTSGFVDGTRTTARFSAAEAIAADPTTGDIVVADTGNARVRRVTSTGVVSTFAGSGTVAVLDGTAFAAHFHSPSAVVCTAAGTTFVAEKAAHVVRQVSNTAVVATLAGTGAANGFADATGAAARFDTPRGVAIDATGVGLLVADAANHRVRQLVVATGVVTTYAGDGIAGFIDGPTPRFSSPVGVTTDATGVAYISDGGNFAIRKILLDQSVATIAGTGATGTLSANGVLAQFAAPQGMALRLGYLFVTDETNSAIRLVAPSALVSTIFMGLTAPSGIAFSADDAVAFVAEGSAHCIKGFLMPATRTATRTQTATRTATRTQTATRTASLVPPTTAVPPTTGAVSSTPTSTAVNITTTSTPVITASPPTTTTASGASNQDGAATGTADGGPVSGTSCAAMGLSCWLFALLVAAVLCFAAGVVGIAVQRHRAAVAKEQPRGITDDGDAAATADAPEAEHASDANAGTVVDVPADEEDGAAADVGSNANDDAADGDDIGGATVSDEDEL
jgi:sugar lactone lactonase YvrE